MYVYIYIYQLIYIFIYNLFMYIYTPVDTYMCIYLHIHIGETILSGPWMLDLRTREVACEAADASLCADAYMGPARLEAGDPPMMDTYGVLGFGVLGFGFLVFGCLVF